MIALTYSAGLRVGELIDLKSWTLIHHEWLYMSNQQMVKRLSSSLI